LIKFGGDKQDRTADLLHAMQALSQLSYTPKLLAVKAEQHRYGKTTNQAHYSSKAWNACKVTMDF
jgi:hypothetical protein